MLAQAGQQLTLVAPCQGVAPLPLFAIETTAALPPPSHTLTEGHTKRDTLDSWPSRRAKLLAPKRRGSALGQVSNPGVLNGSCGQVLPFDFDAQLR